MKDNINLSTPVTESSDQDIAIVGISLRFPGANTKAEFWHNLINKVSSIGEIPTSRWDWRQCYDPSPKKDDQTVISKWGGFIKDIDAFDANFFAISPKEAQSMDPQQRLSMELAWACFEDAGLAPSTYKNTKTGVYLGCSNTDYQEFSTGNIDPHFLTGMSTGVFANRISHFFNFQGPSETVDTACSSSLVALHKALNDFKNNEISAAIVGGVNLLITKSRYVSFSKLGVLSPKGRCKTLDADADGYVRGEGVGMILLLPLAKARALKTPIYGIVKGSSVGHSGKTNTLTSPSPFSQSRVIQEALEAANTCSNEISYVELHGTGTKLGDPLEVQGLKRAFRATRSDSKASASQSTDCYLSTVKTNIGHLESAAGIAGVIKVLLSFQHEQIPPLQNFETLNPKISLKNSPFKLATEAISWPAGADNHIPRLAGVSSFGFAGVNAHVILAAPESRDLPIVNHDKYKQTQVAVILSAKNKDSLKLKATQLIQFIECESLPESELAALAFTLQVGRECMPHRMGVMTDSVNALVNELHAFVGDEPSRWQAGKVSKAPVNPVTEPKTQSRHTLNSLSDSALNALISQWVSGEQVNWSELYHDGYPTRLSLPSYPFKKNAYWIKASLPSKDKSAAVVKDMEVLHPLLHRAMPAFNEIVFQSQFNHQAFYLKDHKVLGISVMPGVCTLEMVRAAIALSHDITPEQMISISQVKWLKPLVVDEPTQSLPPVYLSLWEQADSTEPNAIHFELYHQCENAQLFTVLAKGCAEILKKVSVEQTSLSFKSDTPLFEKAEIYSAFKNVGLNYGTSFQGLKQLQKQHQGLVGKLELNALDTEFEYSPALLDSALHSLFGFMSDNKLALPFALERVHFIQPLSAENNHAQEAWVSVKRQSEHNNSAFDITIYNIQGEACVCMYGLSTRPFDPINASLLSDSLEPNVPSTIEQTRSQNNFGHGETLKQADHQARFLKPVWAPFTERQATQKDKSEITFYGPNKYKNRFDSPSSKKPASIVWLAEEEFARPEKLFDVLQQQLQVDENLQARSLTLITRQTQQINQETSAYTGSGLIGLVQSFAQEYPRWTVRILDIPEHTQIALDEWAHIPAGFYALRSSQWYTFNIAEHVLEHSHRLPQSAEPSITAPSSIEPINNGKPSPYRHQGVYMVLGGAGGLGKVWSEWMIKHYDAQIIWVGRRELNDDIKHAIETLAQLGKAPLYFNADASDQEALADVIHKVETLGHSINGVVHSILHLEDQSIAKMSQAQFLRSYQAKQATAEACLAKFKHKHLDFILFFSSLQSFSPSAGQSNYAAGCHYLDSFALAHQNELPIKIINWGYWGTVGVVQDTYYQEKMASAGIGSIDPQTGMLALAQFMASPLSQVGFLHARQSVFEHIAQFNGYVLSPFESDFKANQTTLELPSNEHQNTHETTTFYGLLSALHQAGWQTKTQRERALAKLPAYFTHWWEETESYLNNASLLNNGQLTPLASCPMPTNDENTNELLKASLAALPNILQAKQTATDVLFPNGSLELVETVYRNNPQADYANNVLIEQLTDYITQQNLSSLKVLEIGAGTGGTTQSVLPALAPWQVEEYTYTDLSNAFFKHAETKFKDSFPFLNTQYFDVSRPLKPQSISIGEYDVVIATNVLHATPCIDSTLQNAKACLKSGGLLLINEVVEKSLFTHLTFGLLKGWWLSQDSAIRTQGSPILSTKQWLSRLSINGFENTHAVAHSDSAQQVFCAQSNGHIVQLNSQTSNKSSALPQHHVKDPVMPLQNEHPTDSSSQSLTNKKEKLKDHVTDALFTIASKALSIPPSELDKDESFADYGVDSILAIQMLDEINAKFALNLPPTVLFDYPSISTLADFLASDHAEQILTHMPTHAVSNTLESKGLSDIDASPSDPSQHSPASAPMNSVKKAYGRQSQSQNSKIVSQSDTRKTSNDKTCTKIAIVGMSGQFGEAENLDAFWSMLINKQSSVKAQTRWDASLLPKDAQQWTRYASLIKDIGTFDASFFSITPQEAMYMDPQQRLFLQQAYHALEDANMIQTVSGQNMGVYLGCAQGDYASLASEDAPAQIFWGNAGSVIPARVSYHLNLKGPAVAVDTACSSSLVAIHMACQALRNNDISSALVGGVATLCTTQFSLHAGKAGMLSPDGTCYTFDDRANGFVPGEGVGVLVLKRLKDAERDGDTIHGVIIGSGTNQDGTTSGITAPSSLSQTELLRQVYERFNIPVESIGLVEAHGTGTKLGDPIEFQALTKAFKADTDKRQFCALGSVKTNIGHCLTAAGVAGVVKTLLSIKHQTIPASLNFIKGNSHIDWHNSPFQVSQDTQQWAACDAYPRRAAISSFGFSGTNAHLVIEEYKEKVPSIEHLSSPSQVVITLSAKTPDALRAKAAELLEWINTQQLNGSHLSSLAYTLQTAREPMEYRLALCTSSIEVLMDSLHAFTEGDLGKWQQGEVKQGKAVLSALDESDFTRWVSQKSFAKLAALWVIGADISWPILYGEHPPKLMRVPTYPFAKTTYWLPKVTSYSSKQVAIADMNSDDSLCAKRPQLAHKTDNKQGLNDAASYKEVHVKPQNIKALNKEMLHLTPNWKLKPLSTHVSTQNKIQLSTTVVIGSLQHEQRSEDEGNITYLHSTKTSILEQLSDYSRQLLAYLKTYEGVKTPTLIQCVIRADKDQEEAHLVALSGMLKTLELEHSFISTQCILLDSLHPMQAILKDEALSFEDKIIAYQLGKRFIFGFGSPTKNETILDPQLPPCNESRVLTEASPELPWRNNGIYVISGGLGKLGQRFAQEILKHTSKGQVILIGRRPESHEVQKVLEQLCQSLPDAQNALARIQYLSADLAHKQSAEQVIEKVLTQFGDVTGIIHSAGIINDALLKLKSETQLLEVINAKATSATHLENTTAHLDLDFFVCFSSLSALFGNLGQADYAIANAYLDTLMHQRQRDVNQGKKRGISLSINWPLWADGGMQVSEFTQALMAQQGICPMPYQKGINAFYKALMSNHMVSQHAFLYGDVTRLMTLCELDSTPSDLSQLRVGKSISPDTLMSILKDIIIGITQLPLQELDEEMDFREMGLDSVMLMSAATQLESHPKLKMEPLSPTLLFEVSTLQALAKYLVEHGVTMVSESSQYPDDSVSLVAPLKTDGIHHLQAKTDLNTASSHSNTSAEQGYHLSNVTTQSTYFPLSKAQQGLWLLHKQHPNLTAYHVPLVFEVESCDISKMQMALNWLCQKHPVLSATIEEQSGLPSQKLFSATPVLESVTLTSVSEEVLTQHIEHTIQQPFMQKTSDQNSKDAHLWRARCFHVANSTSSLSVMVLVFHHIIIDGVSASVLLSELWQAYSKLKSHQPLESTQPDYGFIEFIEWERTQLAGQQAQSLKHFWQSELQGAPACFEFDQSGLNQAAIIDTHYQNTHRIKATQSGKTQRVSMTLEHPQKAKIDAYCARLHINPAAFFVSVFQLVLRSFHSTEQNHNDIVLGVPVLNRPKASMTQSLGLFVNQLPLRQTLNSDDTFETLLYTNQKKLQQLIAHSSYPFSEVVQAVQAPRIEGQHPVFQIGFAYHNFVHSKWFEQNKALMNALKDEFQQASDLLLSLDVTPLEQNYKVVLKGDVAAFESNKLAYLIACFNSTLEKALSESGMTLNDFSLVQQSRDVCGAQPTLSNKVKTFEDTLVSRFITQAHRTPNHTALHFGKQICSYQELNRQSDIIAAHLMQYLPEQSVGTSRQPLIAVCAHPSIELIIAILGILKTGAAYVPLDPNAPLSRIEHILTDSTPNVALLGQDIVIPQQEFGAPLNQPQLATLRIEQCLSTQPMSHYSMARCGIKNDDLAYIIYTSGSTGKPKGVEVEHRQVCHLFDSTQPLFHFSERDVGCLFHSYAFDFSVWEIWGTLLHGGKLIIADKHIRKDSEAFSRLIQQEQITLLNHTPSAFYPLMDWLIKYPERASSLKTIIFGGEALSLARLSPWFSQFSQHTRLVNMFGITETTVHATYLEVTPEHITHCGKHSLIGLPLPGYTIHVFNEHMQPVTPGEVGEMYISGGGVARGYHNNAPLTHSRFINATVNGHTNTRLYKTGDLAKATPQGLLEYIGRVDDQVQIRGFRIELGEVQHAILNLPYVVQTCVTTEEKRLGTALVAFLTVTSPVSLEQVRADLLTHIPHYMVPDHLIFIDAFPLTNNGKIDKQKLHEIHRTNTPVHSDEPKQKVPALQLGQSHLEQEVTDIWCQVLELEHATPHTPFFEAGGNSLLANVLATKITERFNIEFPLTLLFQHSTIKAIADYVASEIPEVSTSELKTQQSISINHPSIQAKPKIASENQEQPNLDKDDSIALIGLSCVYPDSKDHNEFWQNLIQERDLIKRMETAKKPGEVTWLDSWIEGQDTFDPAFFNITEKNARTMSYSQRQLLMHAWKAIEDAGYHCDQIPNTGVYLSATGNDNPDLGLYEKLKDDQFILSAEDYIASTLNQPGTLPTTLSYHLGLTGPSLFVHSNCSSSLSAISLACNALKAKEIEYAIVGAACLNPQKLTGYAYEKGLNFAADARCKVFDAEADGMIGGNGVSVIVLKRADEAHKDADHIYTLIRSVQVNNDGKQKAGFFAPGTQGQMQVIEKALHSAKVEADSISYIEAHGTGTALGDPIEFSSLKQVYQKYTNEKQYCGLGAVKSNLGHTDTLAGLTGIIKTALSLKHKMLPASLHYNSANTQIDFAESPFYVVDKSQPWDTPRLPRRAGVSSFGIGGTNAHAILEEAPVPCAPRYTPTPELKTAIIVLSAHNASTLNSQVQALYTYICQLIEAPANAQESLDLILQRMAYTLQTGRRVMPYRLGCAVDTIHALKQQLKVWIEEGTSTTSPAPQLESSSMPSEQALSELLLNQGHSAIVSSWIEQGFSHWSWLYQGIKLQKMSLPTYSFDLKPYPLRTVMANVQSNEISGDELNSKPSQQSQLSDPQLTLQLPKWVEKPLSECAVTQNQNDECKHVVIFCEMPTAQCNIAQSHHLVTQHHAIEHKIEDYGYQLLSTLRACIQAKSQTHVQFVVSSQLLSQLDSEDISTCQSQQFDPTLSQLLTSFHSLLKTASLECATLTTQLIIFEGQSHNELNKLLQDNMLQRCEEVTRYTHSDRWELTYRPIDKSINAQSPWKENGVYLITGGLGGIGQQLLADIKKQGVKAQIIVTGRKPAEHPDVQSVLSCWQNTHFQLHYHQIDVSEKMSVLLLVRALLQQFGTLSGVIHAAGVVHDTLITKKDRETFSRVLAPKVKGVVALDEATQDINLDFFCCFAGLSGVHGALTQSDYALANAFLDSYMHYRARLEKQGKRRGLSASIDWPYWQDGGMKIDPRFEKMLSKSGVVAMPSALGLQAFYQGLQFPQVLVTYQAKTPQQVESTASSLFETQEALVQHLKVHLREIAAEILGTSKESIDPEVDLGDLGADSVAYITFINRVNALYQLDLSPSILFMHSSLNRIEEYILESHSGQLVAPTSVSKEQVILNDTCADVTTETLKSKALHPKNKDERVAIVGISAAFPDADDIHTFWDNLKHGKDSVSRYVWSEVSAYNDPAQHFPDTINWLGRLSHNESFDPLFFNISPADSLRITQQERLLMMHVWKCIEDAGYDPKSLAGSNTGLFIGCQAGYHDGVVTSSAFAPNRMSYFLDLHGPSEGIDTTCSSSLVAIHKAIQAIQQGDCEQAIVGGVNVIDSPNASLAMHDIGALSPTGRCRTFDAYADGIVRGEGVGMIFIKKLTDSQKDKDHIYATLLGSAVNHGGKSQGFTVPNAQAQAKLLKKAWKNADIDPNSLSYIECHGTGTSLGDPVEIDALKAALKDSSVEQDTSCALGSVKSNIGHLEIAAGIASVIKVLLQIKHKTLVPSLHVDTVNPYLGLDDTPFHVQTSLDEWKSKGPRRAAVSSFGISGVNAHLVLEEPMNHSESTETHTDTLLDEQQAAPSLIILSAKDEAMLASKVLTLSAFLSTEKIQAHDLVRIAYTLQTGRSVHSCRIGWEVTSIDHLKSVLESSCSHIESGTFSEYLLAQTKVNSALSCTLKDWLSGQDVDWNARYCEPLSTIPLPSTVFISSDTLLKKRNTEQPNHITKELTADGIGEPQSLSKPWLLLKDEWFCQPIGSDPQSLDSLAERLNAETVLIIAHSHESHAMLSKQLEDCGVNSPRVVLFSELEALTLHTDTVPQWVFFILESRGLIDIEQQIKPLYQSMKLFEAHDKQPISLNLIHINQDKENKVSTAVPRTDLSALLRSYTLRNPAHPWTQIEFSNTQASRWPSLCVNELALAFDEKPEHRERQPDSNHVRYFAQDRYALSISDYGKHILREGHYAEPISIQQAGVYVVVGALGELGIQLCQTLLTQYQVELIILGRRAKDKVSESLEPLNNSTKQAGGKVTYIECDITQHDSLEHLSHYLLSNQVAVNGLFHLGSAFQAQEESWADFENLMQVKVQGTRNLDTALANHPLDFFVMFSSMAIFGSLNHLSYSYGNGYQNTFSAERNEQVKAGNRQGKTLAINWGYWHSDDPIKTVENEFAQQKGYDLIEMQDAFTLMLQLLSSQYSSVGALLSHDTNAILATTQRQVQRALPPTITHTCESKLDHDELTLDTTLSTRDTVINIVGNVLGIAPEKLDLECDLYDYGFDSISLLKTFQQLKNSLNIELQADAFKNMNTIQSLIDDIERIQLSKSTVKEGAANATASSPIGPAELNERTLDFIQDAGLSIPDNVQSLPKSYHGSVNSVLLTGSTGFLGIHILDDLLSHTKATVYCLVRASSLKKARQRIKANASQYQLNIDMRRIVPIIGDMEQAQLGLSNKRWTVLCDEIQHIVHTASYVNHIQPYFAFKKSVSGTNTLLEMAMTNSIKMMHFVSSTTASTQVNNSHFSVNPIEDFINTEEASLICSGYGQSKWVQEDNIRQAAEAGVPYTIYRFSEISGSSSTGIGNTDDVFHRLLKMMISTPIIAESVPYMLDIIPVDQAAASIVRGMNDEQKRNRVFNVANQNPMPIKQFYELASKHSFKFSKGSKADFIEACTHYAQNISDEKLRIIMEGLLTQRPGYDEYLFEAYFMPMTPYNKENFIWLTEEYNLQLENWQTLFSTYWTQWKTDRHFKTIWPNQNKMSALAHGESTCN